MAFYRYGTGQYWHQIPPELMVMKEEGDSGVRNSFYPMGDTSANPPTMMIMDLAPGAIVRRHFHPCERVEVIVRGEIHVGDDVYYPGDVMTAGYDEPYGPHYAGPEGATTAEVFSTFKGACEANYPTEDGVIHIDLTEPGALASRPALPDIGAKGVSR